MDFTVVLLRMRNIPMNSNDGSMLSYCDHYHFWYYQQHQYCSPRSRTYINNHTHPWLSLVFDKTLLIPFFKAGVSESECL